MARTTKDRRRSERLPTQIPVVVRGMDSSGREFFDRGQIVSVDKRGARVRTRFLLSVGSEVEVQPAGENVAKRLRVVWQGEAGSLQDGMVGVEFLDPEETWSPKTLLAQPAASGF